MSVFKNKEGRSRVLFEDISTHKRKLITFLALILALTVGLELRFHPLKHWVDQPDSAMLHSEPLQAAFDGYYYLSLAHDLAQGGYQPLNGHRAVPDFPARPMPPPLLSVLAAYLNKVSSYSLNWIGALLPGFLAVLLVFPVYGLGKYYGGRFVGLTAALFSVILPVYVFRTRVGWFDTDSMLVTWVCLAALCFLHFSTTKTKIRYFYLTGGLITWFLTLWWWDQAPSIATLLTLFPLFIGGVLFYRPPKKEWLLFCLIIVVAFALTSWVFGIEMIVGLFERIFSRLNYISKQQGGDFPNIGELVSEQQRFAAMLSIQVTAGSLYIGALAVLGLASLVWMHRAKSIFLVVPVGLSVLGYMVASRFLIFAAPVVGIGLAYLIGIMWKMQRRHVLFAGLALSLVCITAWSMYGVTMSNKQYFPLQRPIVIEGVAQLAKQTPKDAVIWAYWDRGYAIQYWAQRATMSDGQYHGGERTVYNAFPYAASSFRQSANFMQFYVTRGKKGIHDFYNAVGGASVGYPYIKELLAKTPQQALKMLRETEIQAIGGRRSPEDWLEFFYPAKPKPLNLFVDGRMLHFASIWYGMGEWNVKSRQAKFQAFTPHYSVRKEDGHLVNDELLDINLETGEVVTLENAKIKRIHIHGKEIDDVIDYAVDQGLIVEYLEDMQMVIVQEEQIANSVFNHLVFHRKDIPEEYFQIVENQSPTYQIWRVKADSLPEVYRPSVKSTSIKQ